MAVVMSAAREGPIAPSPPLRIGSMWKERKPYEARADGTQTAHEIPKARTKKVTSEYGFEGIEIADIRPILHLASPGCQSVLWIR
jgi:hypothetical protein